MKKRHASSPLLALMLAFLAGCAANAQQSSVTPPQPTATAAIATFSCATLALQTTPFHRADLASVPWMLAGSGVSVHLLYATDATTTLYTGDTASNGKQQKILWVVENPKRSADYTIRVENQTTEEVLIEMGHISVFPAGQEPPTDYPELLNFPSFGCWKLTLTTGDVSGMVTLVVLPRPHHS